MTYLQNEDAVTLSVRDRFCLVGMRPILYLMWKNDQYQSDKTKSKNCIPEQDVQINIKPLVMSKYWNAESYKYVAGLYKSICQLTRDVDQPELQHL